MRGFCTGPRHGRVWPGRCLGSRLPGWYSGPAGCGRFSVRPPARWPISASRCPSCGAALDSVERALAARAGRTSAGTARLVGDVQRGLREGHSVAAIAARLGTDRRTLATMLRREVGFGLKRYARLARFERALRVLRAGDAPSLSLAAAQLGFADQPHLTREFRYFAGIAPGRLHRVPGPTPWHVVHDETFKTGRPDPGTLPS